MPGLMEGIKLIGQFVFISVEGANFIMDISKSRSKVKHIVYSRKDISAGVPEHGQRGRAQDPMV
jgi:hypothetical protein